MGRDEPRLTTGDRVRLYSGCRVGTVDYVVALRRDDGTVERHILVAWEDGDRTSERPASLQRVA